jgi:hypothetical protein
MQRLLCVKFQQQPGKACQHYSVLFYTSFRSEYDDLVTNMPPLSDTYTHDLTPDISRSYPVKEVARTYSSLLERLFAGKVESLHYVKHWQNCLDCLMGLTGCPLVEVELLEALVARCSTD